MSVGDVGRAGLRVRYAPNGMIVGRLEEGEPVVILEGPVYVEEVTWYRVVSTSTRLEGWVDSEYLVPAP